MVDILPKCAVLDLDDSCLDFLRPVLLVHYWRTGVRYNRADLLEYNLPKDLDETFRKYEDWIYLSLPILPKVKKAIKEFKDKGYQIVVMTARDAKYKESTEFNLAINEIEYDDIYFNKNKSLKINRLSETYNVQYFVDDRHENVESVKKNTEVPYVYLINTYANRNEDIQEGIIRINNLHEIKII